MSDRVFIEGLEVYCVIGLQDWEREVQQKVRIDIEMETDTSEAAVDDDFSHALDYRGVAKNSIELVEKSSFKLVETMAEKIAMMILKKFPRAKSVKVRVAKPGAVRFAQSVGVEILRHRKGCRQ
jgi:dihydroneopterin aldolase